MYKILFTSALPGELNVVKRQIKETYSRVTMPLWHKFEDGTIVETEFLLLGMWNYETIYNLTNKLNKKSYDFIVNIWVCWYKEEKIDFFQVSRIYNYAKKKEALVPVFFQFWCLENIACREVPVINPKYIWNENYIDMESYWVEFISDKFKIPRILLKVPVDKVGFETRNFNRKKALELLWENIDYKKLLDDIILYLKESPKKGELTKYFDYYRMTFSEKVIFEKLYNEYKVFWWDNFDDFFEKNNDLWKKEFLNKIREENTKNKEI